MKDKDLEKAQDLKSKIENCEWFLDIIENFEMTLEIDEDWDKSIFKQNYCSKDIKVPHYLAERFLDSLKDHYIEKQVALENEFEEL